jgi:hypothetical protein
MTFYESTVSKPETDKDNHHILGELQGATDRPIKDVAKQHIHRREKHHRDEDGCCHAICDLN